MHGLTDCYSCRLIFLRKMQAQSAEALQLFILARACHLYGGYCEQRRCANTLAACSSAWMAGAEEKKENLEVLEFKCGGPA